MKILRIDDKNIYVNALPHLLPLVKDIGQNLNWYVSGNNCSQSIWAQGVEKCSELYCDIEKALQDQELYPISWLDLNKLTECFQIMDGVFIGSKKEATPVYFAMSESDLGQRYLSNEIVIEAFDSSFWLFYCYDESLMKLVASSFEDVEWIDPQANYLP